MNANHSDTYLPDRFPWLREVTGRQNDHVLISLCLPRYSPANPCGFIHPQITRGEPVQKKNISGPLSQHDQVSTTEHLFVRNNSRNYSHQI